MVIQNQNVKRLGVFFFYDKDGIADRYVEYLIKEYASCQEKIIIVSNGEVTESAKNMFLKYTDDVIIRENKGLDFAAYLAAFHSVGWDKLEEYDEISIMNSTLMGPVYPLMNMYKEMELRDVDFWGISKHFKFDYDASGKIPYGYIPEHIQSHHMVFRKSLVKSEKFQKFWDEMPEIKDYTDSVALFEASFTKKFEDYGFKWDTYSHLDDFKGVSFNPIMEYPKDLLEFRHCPLFKRRLFFQDPLVVLNTTFGNPTSDLYKYISEETSYNTDFIWENIIRTCHHADFVKMLNLNYVLSTKQAEENDIGKRKRIVLVLVLKYKEEIEKILQYVKKIPDYVDILFTSDTEDQEYFSKQLRLDSSRNVSYCVRDDKFFVTLNSHIEKYDYCCVLRDMSGDVQVDSFFRKNADNILYNTAYMNNVVSTFEKNKRLGMLVPFEATHGNYFPTLGREWGTYYEGVERTLKQMEIQIPIHKEKEPVAPLGGMFWIRGNVFAEVLKCMNTHKESEMEEVYMRLLPFMVLDKGYYPAYVSTDYGVEIELTTLRYYMREYGKFFEKNGISEGPQWLMFRQFENKQEGHIVNIDSPKYAKIAEVSQKVMPRPVYRFLIRIKRKIFGPHNLD